MFKASRYEEAAAWYIKMVTFTDHDVLLEGGLEAEGEILLQTGAVNLAMYFLNKSMWIDVRNICDKVLEDNDDILLVWFCRSKANLAMNNFELARDDFSKISQLVAGNEVAKRKIVLCQQQIESRKELEKEVSVVTANPEVETEVEIEAESK